MLPQTSPSTPAEPPPAAGTSAEPQRGLNYQSPLGGQDPARTGSGRRLGRAAMACGAAAGCFWSAPFLLQSNSSLRGLVSEPFLFFFGAVLCSLATLVLAAMARERRASWTQILLALGMALGALPIGLVVLAMGSDHPVVALLGVVLILSLCGSLLILFIVAIDPMI